MEIINQYFPFLSHQQKEQIAALQDVYEYWNEKINVISRKDMDNFYERHVLHSLSIAQVYSFKKGHKVADIGTGGGFPGIPLAIFFPENDFLLIDSIGKKINVVKEVATAIHLTNVRAIHARAEQVKENDFDLCVSRAVAPLQKLALWSKHLLKKKENEGLICLKGGDLSEEIKEADRQTQIWNISDYFEEEFFETKKVVWAKI